MKRFVGAVAGLIIGFLLGEALLISIWGHDFNTGILFASVGALVGFFGVGQLSQKPKGSDTKK